MDEDFLKRIGLIKHNKDLKYSDIAESLDVSTPTVINYFTGRTKFPMNKLVVFADQYEVDINWLLRGEEVSAYEAHDGGVQYTVAQGGRAEPVHNTRIRSLLNGLADGFQSGVYDLFDVEGASMEPTIHPGDRLLCRQVTLAEVIDTRIYVIIAKRSDLTEYRKSGVWIKRLQYRSDMGYINCRSDNMDTAEPYPTFRLKIDEIGEIWHPVLRITWHMADPNRGIYDRLDDLESRIEVLEDKRDV